MVWPGLVWSGLPGRGRTFCVPICGDVARPEGPKLGILCPNWPWKHLGLFVQDCKASLETVKIFKTTPRKDTNAKKGRPGSMYRCCLIYLLVTCHAKAQLSVFITFRKETADKTL